MRVKLDLSDRLFALWIKYRDKWTCKRCGKQYNPDISSHRQALHCSHFKGRAKEPTRHLPENCDSLCYGCHSYFTAHPDEHMAWQIATKGQTVVDRIILLADGYKKKDRKAEAKIWRTKLREDYGIVV